MCPASSYYLNMARAPSHDWYFNQWMETLRLTQTDVGRLTGYDKAKMSNLTTGRQRYNRDIINDVARALNIEPFELLLNPADAMALRRMRETALSIAAEPRQPYHTPMPDVVRTGTDG